MEQIKKDLQILCAAEGVGGQTAITEAALKLLQPLVDEVEVDVMGNVLGLRRAENADAPTLMLEAHLDEIGSSPSRTMAGLKAFTQKVILIAGGYDKHIPYDPLGPVAADTVKHAILLGATAGAIETAIRQCSDLPITRVSGMEEAVKVAAEIAGAGDIVFMSPASASFDMYKNFEERGNHFRDLVLALPE